jgi:hypothetical protein
LGYRRGPRCRYDRCARPGRRRAIHLLPVLAMPVSVTPRQLLAIALLGCFVAALFGATPLAAWVDTTVGDGTTLQEAADTWLELTQRAQLDRPYIALRHAVRTVEGLPLNFSSSPPTNSEPTGHGGAPGGMPHKEG